MKFLDRIERKFGRFAIKGLMTYIVVINLIVFILMNYGGAQNALGRLALIPQLVLNGEVWRLVTYIFIPPDMSVIWILFTLYFYYIIGTSLENEWGSFRFNIYYLIGMLVTIAASFITGGIGTAVYLNLSLFLAFAAIYPDYEIRLFLLLPIKVKYLAWLQWALLAYTIIMMPGPFKAAAAASVVNYMIFFGRDIIMGARTKQHVHSNRRRFQSNLSRNAIVHKCEICGITEKDDPKMDFRYCVDCEGNHEYCMKHLEEHEHVRN